MQGLKTHDHLIVVSVLNAVTVWLGLFFLLCNYGESVTNAFESIHPAIYQTSWHTCPLDVQKAVALMLRASEDRIHIKGYASIICSLAMFKQVSNCWFHISHKIELIFFLLYTISCRVGHKYEFLVFHGAPSIQSIRECMSFCTFLKCPSFISDGGFFQCHLERSTMTYVCFYPWNIPFTCWDPLFPTIPPWKWKFCQKLCSNQNQSSKLHYNRMFSQKMDGHLWKIILNRYMVCMHFV